MMSRASSVGRNPCPEGVREALQTPDSQQWLARHLAGYG